MQLKIFPPQAIDPSELEESLDQINPIVRSELAKARSRAFFDSSWSKDPNNNHYVLTIHYTKEGRLKNFIIKRMIKRTFKKINKAIIIE